MSGKELHQIRPLRGQDFYSIDPSFSVLLDQITLGDEREALEGTLKSFSQKVSNEWDALSEEASLQYEGPKVLSSDELGNPIEEIWFPPPTKTLRRQVVEAGIFENRTKIEQYAKVYLLAHIGEAGVVCPLACTEGLIRAVRAVGSDYLKENYLPKLLSPEKPLAAAQFVTEQDMGSDVGALTTIAVPQGEGKWKLIGEKWFCSAIDEYFLIAARPELAPEGTSGVAVFFVPRMLDGRPNAIRIQRLKNKIGTKELPTAEIELEGSVGYNIGPIEHGFKTLMNYAINTSRVMNSASALGFMSRAYLEARNYACQRSAFGKKIIDHPMVATSLTMIQSILAAKRALFFGMLKRMDQKPIEDLSSDEAYYQRFLLNLCKYRTALGATACTREAILQLGGNGTIETFSILPRLYRDSLVIETWEGSHNTLALQVARDACRFRLEDYLGETMNLLVEQIKQNSMEDTAAWLHDKWEESDPLFHVIKDEPWASCHARHFLDHIGALLEIGFLAGSPAKELFSNYHQQIESDFIDYDTVVS